MDIDPSRIANVRKKRKRVGALEVGEQAEFGTPYRGERGTSQARRSDDFEALAGVRRRRGIADPWAAFWLI